MRETRHLTPESSGLRIEERADGQKLIVGYASVYYSGMQGTEYELWPGTVERIMPGAFDRALRESSDVRAAFNHDLNQVLGRLKSGTLRLRSDAMGLFYEVAPPDTQAARDLLTLIKRGDVSGSSFSFSVPPGGQNVISEKRNGITVKVRQITNVELYELGPVTIPAYEATAASVRSLRTAVAAEWESCEGAKDLDFRLRRNRNSEVVDTLGNLL